jgi:hypothetical protein
MDQLSGLRDIHLPEGGMFWFPPAPGWWIVFAAAISIYLIYYFGKKIWQASARYYAERILLSLRGDIKLPAAIKMSEILRRACLRKYPEAVALVGDEWIAYLNQKSKYPLAEKTAELLKNAPYITPDSASFDEQDMQDLWQFCYDWVGNNL